jgi:hypothetical protein
MVRVEVSQRLNGGWPNHRGTYNIVACQTEGGLGMGVAAEI